MGTVPFLATMLLVVAVGLSVACSSPTPEPPTSTSVPSPTPTLGSTVAPTDAPTPVLTPTPTSTRRASIVTLTPRQVEGTREAQLAAIKATAVAEGIATIYPPATPLAPPPPTASDWITWDEVREAQSADGLREGRPRVVTYGVGTYSPTIAYGLRVECVEEAKTLLVNIVETWPDDGALTVESSQEVPVYHETKVSSGTNNWLMVVENTRPAVWWVVPSAVTEEIVADFLSGHAQELLIHINPDHEHVVQMKFSVAGFGDAADAVLERCNWSK